MGQVILFLSHKRAKVCPKMPKLPKFCKQRSLEESWIYDKSPGTSLIGYSLTTAPHLFLPFNHISHNTYFSGMLCYFFLSDNLLCGMYYYQNLHLFSILTEYFHKKTFQICDDFTGYKEDTIWFSLQAFAWFSDLLVEHSEIFWSLFGVDMDTVLSEQPPDT